MRKYKSYKSSGIDWIGDIPEHWKIKKVKYLITQRDGIKIGPFGSSLKLDTLSDHGIKIYGQGNIIKDDFSIGERYIPLERFETDFRQYEIIVGDVLITMMGTMGKCKVFSKENERGILDSHLLRLRFNNQLFNSILFSIVLEKGHYVTQQLKLMSKGSIMDGLNSSIVKDLIILTPPISEQNKLVEFLEEKTKLIDKLISSKENKIELLNEQRRSLINHVVTKGLEQSVKMKDSGIGWIGEIPEHWKVIKIKYVGQVNSGDTLLSNLIESEGLYPVYGGNGVMGYYSNFNFSHLVLSIGRVGEKCGNVHLINEKCWINDNSLILDKKNESIDMNYLFHSLTTRNLNIIRNQNTQPLITGTMVKNETIPFPPKNEQQQIVEFLDNRTTDIDNLISKEQQKINVLIEYKQSLISEVMTGKIDVRNLN